MTFMALLGNSLADEEFKCVRGRCKANPFKKCNYLVSGSVTKTAYISTILVYYKLWDDEKDEGFVKRFRAKAAMLLLKGSKKKAAAAFPVIYGKIKEAVEKQRETELSGTASLPKFCEVMASSLAESIAVLSENEREKRILYQLGFSLGKWIYLIDALDDIEADKQKHRFNAISETKSGEEDVINLLKEFRNEISAAFNLLEIKRCKGILENIIYLGLENREKQILKKSGENNG